MAAHISSVDSLPVEFVAKTEFYGNVRSGDLLFCCGSAEISRAIEDITNSPFSHVLMTWLPPDADAWLTIESTFHHGVHVGQLADYVDGYDGELVLARRPVLTEEEIRKARDAGLRVLDDAYDWKQEVSIAGHRLLKCLPVEIPQKEYYCSGLQYFMSLATRYPLQRPGLNYPTPEDVWADPTVVPVCAYSPRMSLAPSSTSPLKPKNGFDPSEHKSLAGDPGWNGAPASARLIRKIF